MATIRASCDTCGDVKMTNQDVKVRVCAYNNGGEYRFQCPRCRMTIVKVAEPRTIDLLVASGVEMEMWLLPAEFLESHNGSKITHDDVLEMHEFLTGVEDSQQIIDLLLDGHE